MSSSCVYFVEYKVLLFGDEDGTAKVFALVLELLLKDFYFYWLNKTLSIEESQNSVEA